MNVYRYQNYRDLIRDYVSERKKLDRSFNFQFVANEIGVQKPYFSKVINGQADLSTDQVYLLCRLFQFDEEQSAYIKDLLEIERTGIEDFRQELKLKIEKIRIRKLSTEEHLNEEIDQRTTALLAEYNLEPIVQLIHMALAVPIVSKQPKILVERLGIDLKKLVSSLDLLEDLQFIRREEGEVKVLKDRIHLSKHSPFVKPQQALLKLLSVQKDLLGDRDDQYNFSVTFTADEATRQILQEMLIEFVTKAQDIVFESEPEHLYQMNLELFNWFSK